MLDLNLIIQTISTVAYSFWSMLTSLFGLAPIFLELSELTDKIRAYFLSEITGIPVWVILTTTSIISVVSIIAFVIRKLLKNHK